MDSLVYWASRVGVVRELLINRSKLLILLVPMLRIRPDSVRLANPGLT